jgi:hypothetical protein
MIPLLTVQYIYFVKIIISNEMSVYTFVIDIIIGVAPQHDSFVMEHPVDAPIIVDGAIYIFC